MRAGHKQFFVTALEYRNSVNGGKYESLVQIGNASTLQTAKSMAKRYRKQYQEYQPHDIKIYDIYAEDENGASVCVYQEA